MEKVTVLIGQGVNELEIPCMFFDDFEKGVQIVSSILGKPSVICHESSDGNPNTASWIADDERGENGWIFPYRSITGMSAEDIKARRQKDRDVHNDGTIEEKSKRFGKAYEFFTSYYNGCGGCYDLVLKEVPYNTPFVAWDLD